MGNIIAIFNLSKNVPFPKIKGIKSGYSPHHRLNGINYLVSGRHEYRNDKIYYPGESIMTTITFVSWEYIAGDIRVGDEFEVREGHRVVGFGVVMEILG